VHRVVLTLTLLWLACPSTALAAAAPPAPLPEPWPGLVVTGPVRVRAPVLRVACAGGEARGPIDCAVTARFVLVTDVGATAIVRGEPELLLVAGAPLPSGALELPPGSETDVELRVRRSLLVREGPSDPWFMSPLWMRHMVLGESETMRWEGSGVSGALVEGPDVLLESAVSVDGSAAGDVRVSLDGQPVEGTATVTARFLDVGLGREVESAAPGVLRNGGPTLGLGLRADLYRNDDGRFLLRGGYELAFGEYVMAGIEIETNFESLMESLVVEVASPSLLIIFPGLFAGLGVVARQLGPRDADAAMRLRLGIQFPVVSFVGDFDYWPAIGDWTGSAVVRLSI
jgi:hypothetical protein